MNTLKIMLEAFAAALRSGAHTASETFVESTLSGALGAVVLEEVDLSGATQTWQHVAIALVIALSPTGVAFCRGFAESVEAATAPPQPPQ